MKVNDPNLTALGSTGASKTQEAARTGEAARPRDAAAGGAAGASDDVHLSELVRSLRALASDSPEREALLVRLEKAIASGNYKVDAKALSKKIIDDAIQGG